MKKIVFLLVCNVFMLIAGYAQQSALNISEYPLELEFHRLAVRRFIFSNNISLSEFVPSEIVSFESMHPAFGINSADIPMSDPDFHPIISEGRLMLNKKCSKKEASFYVGAVNPYATYDVDIYSLSSDAEAGFELARLGRRDRVQLFAKADSGIYLRIYANDTIERQVQYTDTLPKAPFTLRAQLYGHSLGAFIEKDGHTEYLGYVSVNDNFNKVIDFRKNSDAQHSTFNVISNCKGEAQLSGARSYLSTGIGQADIRLITHEDLSPYMEDNRLWFTFSCRGIDIFQSSQGVMSVDPSVFDVKFEGMIVFDNGDGLLRNDYASHLFYDRKDKLWKAYACDFGGTANRELRSGTGMITATSVRDPRRGFSVMKAKRIETDHVKGYNEDPCIFYDSEAGKWRLLTSVLSSKNIVSGTFESDTWDGVFTPVTEPISMNSTGTSLQKVNGKIYAFMGGKGNLRVHTYPDLELLGELNLDLQPHWPKPAGRVWASIVPLPDGYPYKYVLLTMDRPNFPGIKGSNWSYGALYFYGAK